MSCENLKTTKSIGDR